MIIVSDSSPIINLAAIGHLDLLHQLYNQILIPQAIYNEIVLNGAGLPGAHEVQTSSWIITQTVPDPILVKVLEAELDTGEAEALALAVTLKADLLLIDERLGRNVAKRLGLKFIGLLGILILAKHQKLIALLKPLLEELITKAGFWVSPQLYATVLEAAGE